MSSARGSAPGSGRGTCRDPRRTRGPGGRTRRWGGVAWDKQKRGCATPTLLAKAGSLGFIVRSNGTPGGLIGKWHGLTATSKNRRAAPEAGGPFRRRPQCSRQEEGAETMRRRSQSEHCRESRQNSLLDWVWERRGRDPSEGPCHPVRWGRLPRATLGGMWGSRASALQTFEMPTRYPQRKLACRMRVWRSGEGSAWVRSHRASPPITGTEIQIHRQPQGQGFPFSFQAAHLW